MNLNKDFSLKRAYIKKKTEIVEGILHQIAQYLDTKIRYDLVYQVPTRRLGYIKSQNKGQIYIFRYVNVNDERSVLYDKVLRLSIVSATVKGIRCL